MGHKEEVLGKVERGAITYANGAKTGWQRFRLVTWPMLGPTTLFVVTISIINAVTISP